MELSHIGLNIKDKNELVDFYENILGFNLEYQFEMDSAYAKQLFTLEKPTEVFLYKKDLLSLELFVQPEAIPDGFSHVCIQINDRDFIAEKCKNSGYPVIRITRNNKPDILFIKDKAGNSFELKI